MIYYLYTPYKASVRRKMMKQRIKYLILPIITLILEILPYGVVLNFARPSQNGEIGYFKEYYSYFDLMSKW